MAMLPIFMIGFIMGILLSTAYFEFKKDVPSDVKVHIQEAEILKQKNDIEMLEKLNQKLYDEIAELKKEIK